MIAALLLLAQQPQTVTFTHPAAHSSVVLEALGKELGVTMKPSGSVNQDYFLLRFDKTPVQEALDKIAATLNATWNEKDGVTYLGRTKAQEDAAMAEYRKRREQAIADYIEKDALRMSVWTQQRITDLMRPTFSNGALVRSAATAVTNKAGPMRELLDEFIRTVGSKKLGSLPEGESVLFKWAPSKGEEKIPVALRAKTETLLKSIETFGAAMTAMGVSLDGDFDLPSEVRLAGAPGLTADAFAFRAQLNPGGAYVILTSSGGNPVPWASASIVPKTSTLAEPIVLDDLEGLYEPSQLGKVFIERMLATSRGNARRLDSGEPSASELLALFESRFEVDPIHLSFGEVLIQIAEKLGHDIVASMSDGTITYPYWYGTENQRLKDIVARLSPFRVITFDEGMIAIPQPFGPGAGSHFDRRAVAKLALVTYERGWPDIDAIAEYAASCDDDFAWQQGRRLADTLQPVRLGFLQRAVGPALLSFKLYDSLPSAAKSQAHRETVSLPLVDLPRTVRDKAAAALIGRGFRAKSDVFSLQWSEWPTAAFATDRKLVAEDLNGAILDVRVESREFLAAQDVRSDGRVSSFNLMDPKSAAERIVDQRTNANRTIDASSLAIVQAERLLMIVRLQSGEVLQFAVTVDSRNSETVYRPYSQLEGELATQLKKEIAKIDGTPPGYVH